jgi:hypothetical protein
MAANTWEKGLQTVHNSTAMQAADIARPLCACLHVIAHWCGHSPTVRGLPPRSQDSDSILQNTTNDH